MKLTSQELSKKCYDAGITVKTDKVFGWRASLEKNGWEEEYHLLRLNYEPDDWDLQTDRKNHPDLPCASLDEWMDWFDEKLPKHIEIDGDNIRCYIPEACEGDRDWNELFFIKLIHHEKKYANACAAMALWLVEQGIIKI